MRKLFTIMAAAAFLFGTTAAQAAILPATATLNVAIGTLPPAGFVGASAGASSAGVGGAATLPSGSISGIFQTAIVPPLLTLLDGIGVGAPACAAGCIFATAAAPATNNVLGFNGVTGTMSLNASAYLLMGGANALEIPLGVIGVGGTQMFHALTLVAGVINANPYQLGALSLMGALNTVAHTVMGTGVDNRTAGGAGTLVLVSPTNVNLGVLGTLASIATLTITYVPEPGTLLLLGAGVAGLAAIGRKRMA
jgi:hypothetical protein